MTPMSGDWTGVVIVNDLHVGSIYGLLPPGFTASSGAVIGLTPGQEYLYNCLDHFSTWVRGFSRQICAVIVNGDAIDGAQSRQNGGEFSLPLFADQTTAARQVLEFFLTTAGIDHIKRFFIQGTEYHDAGAGREMEVLAETLGGTPYGGLGTGRYSHEVLDRNINGVVLNVAHHIGGASGFYRATAADREAVFSALAGKEGKAPRADILARAHRHHYVLVEHASKWAFISPCWQLQTRFMRKNSVYRMIPDIGGVVIWIDGAAHLADPTEGIYVQKKLYPLPPMIAENL